MGIRIGKSNYVLKMDKKQYILAKRRTNKKGEIVLDELYFYGGRLSELIHDAVEQGVREEDTHSLKVLSERINATHSFIDEFLNSHHFVENEGD